MKLKYTVALSVVVGVAIGATAMQGLHAQVKKVYWVSETEALDDAAVAAYAPLIRAAIDAAGGKRLNVPGGKGVAFVGAPPKRVAISEWDSLEAVEKFYKSDAFTKLAPQRDKAAKTIRSFAVQSN
jgi:uncharacterized protein (DUF1330 family)